MPTTQLQNIKQRYEIIGNNEDLMRALDVALQVASTDLSVLIVGESGVGKEVIPRIIHDNSKRKHNKYIAINCGSIPEGTIDSELFGHAKGAFTGAIGEREGYFGAADGGTLFLDEVGELPLATQARLLRVLETGEYIRVGENQPKKTNVRIVAATNVNMRQAITEGRFRRDLYYRLCAIPIYLPPLRDRGKDIEMIFRKFAFDISEKYHFETKRLTDDAKDLLLKYSWPGNIRELRNLTEQVSIICDNEYITADDLRHFGITDDSNVGSSMIPSHHQRGTKPMYDDPHSWANERESIIHAITKLGQEISELKEFIHNGGVPDPVSPTLTLQHSQNSLDQIEEIIEAKDEVDVRPSLSIKEIELNSIKQALERYHGNRRMAAQELGISERTLYRKLKEYGLMDEVKK
ncbi:MAG: sigma-54 dependent transcriptional regulator [Bacteroidaceae bacterium]|nr:sigma-54 dependent transcriptional regulator [Bacteroidaceae bacterium]